MSNLLRSILGFLLICTLVLSQNSFCYATGCPTVPTCTYTAVNGSSYSVSSGQTICVTGITYNSGTITLSGGTIYVASGATLDISHVASGSTVAITGATNASPIVITATAHGYSNGQTIGITSVGGNLDANGTWVIANATANTFELVGSTGSAAYTSGGAALKYGTIDNCGTISGSTSGIIKNGLTINNYSTSSMTIDYNYSGGTVNNYASASFSISNSKAGAKFENMSGGVATITSLSTQNGSYIINNGTMNFPNVVTLSSGNAANYTVLTNSSGATMNFNATGSTGLFLNSNVKFVNSGTATFATTSGNQALYSEASSIIVNNTTGIITATTGDYLTNGGDFNNYGSATFRDFSINSNSANINLYDYALLKVTTLLSTTASNRVFFTGTNGNCSFIDASGGSTSGNLSLTSSSSVKVCGTPGAQLSTQYSISALTNATPTTITSAVHGFSVGQVVYLNLNSGTVGTLTTGYYEVSTVVSTTQVKLKNLSSPYANVGSTSTTVAGGGGGNPYFLLSNFGSAIGFGSASTGCTNGNTNHTCSNPLPIELLSFDAKVQNNDVLVTWTSATEENNKFYTVLRSLDGVNFEPIGIVSGAGNSSQPIEYHFVDQNPLSGTSYYKLQQTDFDGKSESFNIVTVNYKLDDNAWVLYPNPTNGNQLYIKFLGKTSSTENPVLVNIYDLAGKEIFNTVLENYSEHESLLNTSNELSKGVYLVKVRFNDAVRFERLVVK